MSRIELIVIMHKQSGGGRVDVNEELSTKN